MNNLGITDITIVVWGNTIMKKVKFSISSTWWNFMIQWLMSFMKVQHSSKPLHQLRSTNYNFQFKGTVLFINSLWQTVLFRFKSKYCQRYITRSANENEMTLKYGDSDNTALNFGHKLRMWFNRILHLTQVC